VVLPHFQISIFGFAGGDRVSVPSVIFLAAWFHSSHAGFFLSTKPRRCCLGVLKLAPRGSGEQPKPVVHRGRRKDSTADENSITNKKPRTRWSEAFALRFSNPKTGWSGYATIYKRNAPNQAKAQPRIIRQTAKTSISLNSEFRVIGTV
jgi:hypothetical protein